MTIRLLFFIQNPVKFQGQILTLFYPPCLMYQFFFLSFQTAEVGPKSVMSDQYLDQVRQYSVCIQLHFIKVFHIYVKNLFYTATFSVLFYSCCYNSIDVSRVSGIICSVKGPQWYTFSHASARMQIGSIPVTICRTLGRDGSVGIGHSKQPFGVQ